MNRKEYSYCFLRYSQDPESGEFANVGLALWSRENRFLGFMGTKRQARLKHFFNGLDERGFRRLIEYVDRQFRAMGRELAESLPLEALPDSVRGLAYRVVPLDEGSLVWGGARAGLTANPEMELKRLFDRHIGKHFRPAERSNRSDDQVFREVYRKAFETPIVAQRRAPHEVQAPLAEHCFEQAWKNGVWHVYETLSFDLLEPDSIDRKANEWCSRGTQLARSADEPRIHYLLGKPTHENCWPRYDRARKLLEQVPRVVLVQEEEAKDFANRLEAEVKRDLSSAG